MLKFINKDCALTLWFSLTACNYLMWLCNQFFKKMMNTFQLWILYITYWGQYKPWIRKKWNHTKIRWNWPRCKISPPSFSLRWDSIPDWGYTIIPYFLINSGNMKRVAVLYLWRFTCPKPITITEIKYKICSELYIKTLEQNQWCHSALFIVNFEEISHFALVFLLFTWNK